MGFPVSPQEADPTSPELVINLNDWSWRAAQLLAPTTGYSELPSAANFFDTYDRLQVIDTPADILTSNDYANTVKATQRYNKDDEAQMLLQRLGFVSGTSYFHGILEVTGDYKTQDRRVRISDINAFLAKVGAITAIRDATYGRSKPYFEHLPLKGRVTSVEKLKTDLTQVMTYTSTGELYKILHSNPVAEMPAREESRRISVATDLVRLIPVIPLIDFDNITAATEPAANES